MGILDHIEVLTDRPRSASLSETFLENTKLRPWGVSELALVPGEYDEAEIEAMMRAYKRYRLRPSVQLPTIEELDLPSASLVQAIVTRRTVRSYGDEPLSLADLAAILSLSGGVTGHHGKQAFRAAPSAGALFPIEIYLGVRHVAGLDAGIYHYDWPVHALARVGELPADEQLSRVCCWQPQATECAVVVLLAGVLQRTSRKYGDRGLRYVFLDAGHLAQNLCLAATAFGIGCMTTCGFFDDEANDMCGLDGVAESMLYVAFLGPPATRPGSAPTAPARTD